MMRILALPQQVWAARQSPTMFVAQGRPSGSKAWRSSRTVGLQIVRAVADSDDEAPLAASSREAEAGIEALEAKLGVGRRRNRKGAGGADRKRIGNSRITEGEMRQAKISKEWESMTLSEKAWELYTGETGVLFWLNKAAYASIFILVGGWIVFRFIGPALGWYELDSPLLPPDQVFRSSN